MGMYDYIRCEMPLPGDPPEDIIEQALEGDFHTKSLGCTLALYIIQENGVLDRELDPPRDFNGWSDEKLQAYTGEISFHTTSGPNGDWYQYVALVLDGKVIAMRRVRET